MSLGELPLTYTNCEACGLNLGTQLPGGSSLPVPACLVLLSHAHQLVGVAISVNPSPFTSPDFT